MQRPDPEGASSDWTADQKRCAGIHHPEQTPTNIAQEYPAHMHLNLLPRLQHPGLGALLLQARLELARDRGAPNRCGGSCRAAYFTICARDAASSTPEGPAPTSTNVICRVRSPSSWVVVASSNAPRILARIVSASLRLLRPGVYCANILYVVEPFDFKAALGANRAALEQKIADRNVKELQAERRRRLSDLSASTEEKQTSEMLFKRKPPSTQLKSKWRRRRSTCSALRCTVR
jgi:hypothetical protein